MIRAHNLRRMPFQLGWGERTDQSESAACHLSTLPHLLSHAIDMAFAGTEVVTSAYMRLLYLKIRRSSTEGGIFSLVKVCTCFELCTLLEKGYGT
jgi:hypothetical protein